MGKVALKEEAAVPAVVSSEATALISMIERAAKDPNVDIVKMERLFEMSERVRQREAESAFNAAMALAQAEIAPVAKNKYNNQTSSKYADLAAIVEAIMPVLGKHGFGVVCSEFKSDVPNCMGVSCSVKHSGGHSERHEFNVPLDGTGIKGNPNKTATHAYGSTFMYGRRYAICGVFNVATTEDTDGNTAGASDDKITQEQADKIKALIVEVGADIPRFLAMGGVDAVEDIQAAHYQKAVDLLEMKRRAKK